MKIIKIKGGNILKGKIEVSGAKNAAVALIPASILSDDIATIYNVPEITDIVALEEILRVLNCKTDIDKDRMTIDTKNMKNIEIGEEISQKLRASYYFMGALLGKYHKVSMYFPGGCSIGTRPIDLHLKGFEALGAKVENNKNQYIVSADKLKGADIYLDFASVGATINIMLAAVKAEGTTTIDNAAKEPEIVNVATYLNSMGAKISGAGTSKITIKGVKKLSRAMGEIIPDRIEAGTYIIIGALTGDKLRIEKLIPEHIEALISKLEEMKVDIKVGEDYVEVSKTDNLLPANIKTAVYPGFATDLQQPLTVLQTQCNGKSTVTETIYENRFMHIAYLNEMGAKITTNNTKAIIEGKTNLKGCEVAATDLRGGAAMVEAGLIAKGTTIITKPEHILRGYSNIIKKLKKVGAEISVEEVK
jgi:UDP-N-acetylglucosamine 1-carboxyvinyltransferase